MELPQSISLSKRATDRFRLIKTRTGVPHNVLARIALSLAIDSEESVDHAPKEDSAGQTLDRDLLFGELVSIYEVIVREYACDREITMPVPLMISSLIEIGSTRMGHVRSLEQLCQLNQDTSTQP